MEKQKLSEEDINIVIQVIVNNYQMFDNDVVDLMNASGKTEEQSRVIVRKRYKDFMIN